MPDRDGPILIEIDDAGPNPAEAPPIDETHGAPTGQAMQTMAAFAARQPSTLVRWFWRLLAAVVLFFASIALWDWIIGLLTRNPTLGWAAAALLGAFLIVCLGILLREWAALARLQKIEALHTEADRVAAENDLAGAKQLVSRLSAFYAGREDMRWGRQRLSEAESDTFDADTLLGLAEDTLLRPLDDHARREVETASRQVATVTALVPMALADVLVALMANIRMIRRIAEIYGGRSGALGAWRLTRTVVTHLVATGAVAVGDDLLGSIGGGHLLAKISRRFGEGLVNGALTARVGVAAMEVCRPLPFRVAPKPRVSQLVGRAFTGLFDRADTAEREN